jgi:hypothetical protein
MKTQLFKLKTKNKHLATRNVEAKRVMKKVEVL